MDTAARERAAQSLGVRGFRDLGELLAETQPDVVVLATPSGLHSHQAIEVAKSGRHVLTEKPVATRWQDGLKMVEACDNAKVHLFVVKQNRLNPTLQLVRKAIDQKRFGRIFIVSVNVFWSRPQEYYDSARWRGTREFADVRDEDKKIQEVNYQIQSVYGKGHTPYYGNVIRSLRGEEAPLTDGREGLACSVRMSLSGLTWKLETM